MARTSNFWIRWTSDGKEHVELNQEAALAQLLKDEILFCNCRYHSMFQNGKSEGETIVLFVVTNDIFAWGTADAENLTTSELPELFDAYEKNPKWGSTIWACKKRNEQPQHPIKLYLIKDNLWTTELEKLPENYYDRACRNAHLKKLYEIS